MPNFSNPLDVIGYVCTTAWQQVTGFFSGKKPAPQEQSKEDGISTSDWIIVSLLVGMLCCCCVGGLGQSNLMEKLLSLFRKTPLLQEVFSYLEFSDILKIQAISKEFYYQIIPKYIPSIPFTLKKELDEIFESWPD